MFDDVKQSPPIPSNQPAPLPVEPTTPAGPAPIEDMLAATESSHQPSSGVAMPPVDLPTQSSVPQTAPAMYEQKVAPAMEPLHQLGTQAPASTTPASIPPTVSGLQPVPNKLIPGDESTASFSANQSGGMSVPQTPTAMAWEPQDNMHGKKALVLGAIVVVALALVGIGGYAVYQRFYVSEQMPATITEDTIPVVPVTPTVDTETVDSEEVVEQPSIPNTTETTSDTSESSETVVDEATVASVDNDGDGLTDAEEAIYGTDPFLADSDRDGLFDREEIVTWKTNPLNPDSDGDTYLDGQEVENGYDPLGPGQLEYYEYISL